MTVISLRVNGEQVLADIQLGTPLLTVLRNYLGLKAAKFGCGQSLCGACTIWVDGRPTYSCDFPVQVVGDSESAPWSPWAPSQNRIRCSGPSSTGRSGSAGTACPGSSCGRPPFCGTIPRPAEPTWRRRWTRICAGAAVTSGSSMQCCEPDERARREPVREPSGESADLLLAGRAGGRHRDPAGRQGGTRAGYAALSQIAIRELGLPPGKLVVAPVSTAGSPDEAFTAASCDSSPAPRSGRPAPPRGACSSRPRRPRREFPPVLSVIDGTSARRKARSWAPTARSPAR